MAKVINFTYKDKDYTLKYTRKTLDKNEMYNKLSEMAMEKLNTLFEDSTEKNAIKWTATF